MERIYFITYISGALFFTVLTGMYFRSMLSEAKTDRYVETFGHALLFTASSVFPLVIDSPLAASSSYLLSLFLFSMLYCSGAAKRIFTVLSLFLYVIFTHFGLIILSGYGNFLLFNQNRLSSTAGIVLECLLFYMFYLCAALVRKTFRENLSAAADSAFILMIPLALFLFLCLSLIYKKSSSESFLLFSVSVLASVNLFALLLHGFRLLQTELVLTSAQNSHYQNELDIIHTSDSRINSLRHDLSNHLMILSELIEGQDYNQAEEYLSRIKAELKSPDVLSSTGNTAVDSLINYKLQNMNNTEFNYTAEIPSQLRIDSFDLTIILGNLLDNAVEALRRQSSEKKNILSVLLRYDAGKLSIRISNSFSGKLQTDGNRIRTKKNDAALHGIGLKNGFYNKCWGG